MTLLDNAQNFQDAMNRIDDIVEESNSDKDAENKSGLAEGYISALRYNNLIDHNQFKKLEEARTTALSNWYYGERRRAIIDANKRAEENNPWPKAEEC